MTDPSPDVLLKKPDRSWKPSYLWVGVIALATLPKVFLVGPILGHNWPFAREITQLGGTLCNPVVGNLQPASCGPDNTLPDDLLFTAGLGMLYAMLLVALIYSVVIVRSRISEISLKRFAIWHVLGFVIVLVFFVAWSGLCDVGWYCFESSSLGELKYREAGRVWSVGTFLIVVPVFLPMARFRN